MSRRQVSLVARFEVGLQARILQARVPEFIALHPELDLTVQVAEPEPGVTEKVMRGLLQGRREADILELHSNNNVPLALKGNLREQFLDLTDLVSDAKVDFLGWEPCTWHGRIYGLPSLLSGSAYFYRPDVFSEMGIDPNSLETWDDFIRAGIEVKEATGAYMTPLDTQGYNQFQPLALQNGGGWFDSAGQVIIDSDNTIEALQLYCDLLRKYEIAYPASKFYAAEVWDAFRKGKIVGCYMPEWYGAFELPHNVPEMAGKFRITLAPAFRKGGRRSGYRGGMCASVPRGPNEDIAFELLRHSRLTLPSQVALLQEFSQAPCMPAAYETPEAASHEHRFLGGQKVGRTYAEIAREMVPFQVAEKLLDAQEILKTHVIPKVATGKLEPREALVEAGRLLRKSQLNLEAALGLESDLSLRVSTGVKG